MTRVVVSVPAIGYFCPVLRFPGASRDRQAAFHPEYITDANGNREAVALPIEEYESLIEDLADLAIVAERRSEPTLSHEAVMG